jgi:hypothetical protein
VTDTLKCYLADREEGTFPFRERVVQPLAKRD